jgi:hypothetical protein
MVAAAIPAGVEVPKNFWRDLDDALEIFRVQDQKRTNTPPSRDRQKWQRIIKRTDALIADLESVQAPWLGQALSILKDMKYHAESAAIGYETLATGYGGRSKPHRELLYTAICDLWIRFGQELKISRAVKGGTPKGPLVQFFQACIAPALGDVSAETVASIIDRERKRRSQKRPLIFRGRQAGAK